MPRRLVLCLRFLARRLFRHLSEKAPADSTNLWITTKSETDRLPRRAGLVSYFMLKFLIFSICPGSDICMRSVRRDGWNLECDGFGTGFCRDRRRVWYWIWRLRRVVHWCSGMCDWCCRSRSWVGRGTVPLIGVFRIIGVEPVWRDITNDRQGRWRSRGLSCSDC